MTAKVEDVWVTGRVTDASNPRRLGWRLLAICTDEAHAIEACSTKQDFIRPFAMNTKVLDGRLKEIRFPLREKK